MRPLLIGMLCALAGACVSAPMPAHTPTLTNVQLLRRQDVPPLALGAFALAEGLPAHVDRSIGVRADTLRAPGDSFSQHLRQTLEAELVAAGKLDAASGTVISGFLTRSQVETAGADSSATLGARFIVTRDGRTVYDQEHIVTRTWPSQFLGAIAIPEAMNHYNGLYPDLVTDVLESEAFRRALREG